MAPELSDPGISYSDDAYDDNEEELEEEEEEDEDEEDEDEEDEDEEDEEEEEGDEVGERPQQSPWEFSSFTESVADEHERRRTTSVDAKIARARMERPLSLPHRRRDGEAEDEDGDEDEVIFDDEYSKKVPYSISIPLLFVSISEQVVRTICELIAKVLFDKSSVLGFSELLVVRSELLERFL